MCLQVHEKQKKVIVTKEPFLVYKRTHHLCIHSEYVVTPFLHKRLQFGKLYRSEVRATFPRDGRISQGFHSMRASSLHGQWRYYPKMLDAALPAVIPAGSKIWYGEDGDVVSNQLIVFRDMKEVKEWYANKQL